MKNRLILLPVSPIGSGGYNRAVSYDLNRLECDKTDHIIIYNHPGQFIPTGCDCIERPTYYSFQRIINTMALRPSTDITEKLLAKKLKGKEYNEIFCGDVVLYRAARAIFPGKKIIVRFHNLFSLGKIRQETRKMSLDVRFRLNLFLFSKLECTIFRDNNIVPIFINENECQLFKLYYPGRNCELWCPELTKQVMPTTPTKASFIYFGAHAHHQKPGIIWFLKKVFAPLKEKWPSVTMHFWGIGGGSFHNPERGIYHHGDYSGDFLPMAGEGLFINPDLLGGGIKFKVGEWLSKGVPFISTPYGIEGYEFKPHENIIIADTDEWVNRLEDYFLLRKFQK